VKISRNLFGCSATRDRGTCDNRLNIRIEVLERTIVDGLRERLMAPEPFKEFCTEFHRELNRLQSEGNEALDDPRSRDEAFDTIRSLIEEIRLVPENGELGIEIKGELGGFLSLCQASETRKPGQGGRAVAEPFAPMVISSRTIRTSTNAERAWKASC
jgi:hypothetical protein